MSFSLNNCGSVSRSTSISPLPERAEPVIEKSIIESVDNEKKRHFPEKVRKFGINSRTSFEQSAQSPHYTYLSAVVNSLGFEVLLEEHGLALSTL